MAIVYPLGIPLLYLCLLYHYRKHINPDLPQCDGGRHHTEREEMKAKVRSQMLPLGPHRTSPSWGVGTDGGGWGWG